eukprot:4717433-Pyramimonas_sp.AAC.1
MSIVIWGPNGQDVATIAIYLAAFIGFSGENIKEMWHLSQIVRSLGNTPWIACGDFDGAPQELAETPWLKPLGGAVV